MLSSYFIELRTGVDYAADTYEPAATRLAQLLVSLADPPTLDTLTHDKPRDDYSLEVECSMESEELVCKAVLDITAPEKVALDKSKLSKLLKARPEAEEWPKLKVLKKNVAT